MRLAVAALLLVLLVLCGCSTKATMVPVEGPLSKLEPVPVFTVKVDGIQGNSGKLSFTAEDGKPCKGRWSSAAGTQIGVAGGSLISQYGSTYLTGYTISSGKGQNPGAAIITCDNARTIQAEFITGSGTAHGFGIAKDNQGNIYRLVF